MTWTCVGDRAGTPWSSFGGQETWGRVRPAHAEPETSAIGLLAVGQAVGDFVATDAIPVDRVTPIDWQSNDAFAGLVPATGTSDPGRRVHARARVRSTRGCRRAGPRTTS